MKKNNFTKSTEAVVGVVVAILLVGLVVALISLIQTMYVPVIMEEKEAQHMEQVGEQFASLKSSIDNQISGQHTPVSTSITLGSKELPFFMSLRSFGTLEIIPESYNISINYKPDPDNETTIDHTLGIIKFSSVNGYFVDHNYIYETGAVIASQSYGDMLLIRPSFEILINPEGSNQVIMNYTLVNITGIGRKTFVSGYSTYPIQTEFHRNFSRNYHNVKNISIETDYINSWRIYLNNSFSQIGLLFNEDYVLVEEYNRLIVRFLNTIVVDMNLNFVDIYAQIGPGWIEE